MWETIKELLGNMKFRVAVAAVIVWGASSFAGLELAPGAVEAALAVVAGWLGVATALAERSAARARERAEEMSLASEVAEELERENRGMREMVDWLTLERKRLVEELSRQEGCAKCGGGECVKKTTGVEATWPTK